MLHETCIPALKEEFFKTDPRVSGTKTLDRDGKQIAFNSYDYQCLKDEIERLPDDIKANFDSLCPILLNAITETDNRASKKYPVRDVQYFRHRNDLFYLTLRLLDEIYYTTTTSVTTEALVVEFLKTARRRSVILNFAELSTEKLLEYFKKPRAILKQLIAVEFNAGEGEKHGRGTFGTNKNDWMYPLLNPDKPDAGRVTAFKMTVSQNELVRINKELRQLRQIYSAGGYAEPFDTEYPLLAILGIDDSENGFFCDANIAKGKYGLGYNTVKYSSRLSTIVRFNNLAEKAVTDQRLLKITMTNDRQFDFVPHKVLHQFNSVFVSGIRLDNQRYIHLRFEKVVSMKLSDQRADIASWEHLLPNEDVEECEITLAVGGNYGDLAHENFIESMRTINVKVKERAWMPGATYNPYIDVYLVFEAKPCYVLFEKIEKLHRNGQLLDIFPADVKKQYEEFWAGLGWEKYSYKYYNYFNR